MSKRYKILEDGRIRLFVTIGRDKNRIDRSKIIPSPKGRERDRTRKIEHLLQQFEQEILQLHSASLAKTQSLKDFSTDWLFLKQPDLAATTFEKYQTIVDLHLIPYLGNTKLDKISPFDVQKMLAEQSETLSSRTRKDIYHCLQLILNDAVRWDVLQVSPIQNMKSPSAPKKELIVFSESVLPEVFRRIALEPVSHQAVFLLAIVGGLRRSEICGLDISSINFTTGYINISKSYVRLNQRPILKTTKSNRERHLRLPDFVLSVLSNYRKEIEAAGIQRWEPEHKHAFFVQSDGKRIYPTTPTHWWGAFLAKNDDLPHVTFHGLRHTSASLLISHGIDVDTVSRRLGHSRASTTLNIYTHLISEKDDEILDVFSDIRKQ